MEVEVIFLLVWLLRSGSSVTSKATAGCIDGGALLERVLLAAGMSLHASRSLPSASPSGEPGGFWCHPQAPQNEAQWSLLGEDNRAGRLCT